MTTILETGRALRGELRETRQPFTQSEFRQKLATRCPDATPESVARAAAAIDSESLEETELYHGFNLGGEYDLGDGLRVARRYALREHVETHLEVLNRKSAAMKADGDAYRLMFASEDRVPEAN